MADDTRKFKREFHMPYLAYFHVLEDVEKKILTHHFGLMGAPKLSDEQIAELLRKPGVNTVDIKQQIAQAVGKLRDAHDRDAARQRAKDVSSSDTRTRK